MAFITRDSQRTFHRNLFAGISQTLTLLKRNDNLQAGTVTAYLLFDCWKGTIRKYGEVIGGPGIDADQQGSHNATWHIPAVELERVGVYRINPLDKIVEEDGRYWQPEATTVIVLNLMEGYVDVECVRIDPGTI